jgi:hypothetical protein
MKWLCLSLSLHNSLSVVIISVRHDIVLNYICSSSPESFCSRSGWLAINPFAPLSTQEAARKTPARLIIAPSRINSRASVVLIKRSSLSSARVRRRPLHQCQAAGRFLLSIHARPPTLICLIGQVLIGQLAWEHNADQRRRELGREF